jgi:hypothetical protein
MLLYHQAQVSGDRASIQVAFNIALQATKDELLSVQYHQRTKYTST